MRALAVAMVFAAGLTGHPGPSGVLARQRATTTTSQPVRVTTTSSTTIRTTTSTTATTSSTTSVPATTEPPAPTTTEPDPDPGPGPGPGPGSTAPATTLTTLPTGTTLVPPSTVAPPPTTTPPTVEIDKPSVEPGGVVVLTGDGCGPGAPVVVGVGDLTVGSIPGQADGTYVVVLTLPDLDPGRYDVHIDCPVSLAVPLDVVVATSVGTPNSVLALFVFFVLLGLVLFRRRRLVFRPRPPPVDSGDGLDP